MWKVSELELGGCKSKTDQWAPIPTSCIDKYRLAKWLLWNLLYTNCFFFLKHTQSLVASCQANKVDVARYQINRLMLLDIISQLLLHRFQLRPWGQNTTWLILKGLISAPAVLEGVCSIEKIQRNIKKFRMSHYSDVVSAGVTKYGPDLKI